MMHRFGEYGWSMGLEMNNWWWWLIWLIVMVIIVWVGVTILNKRRRSKNRRNNKASLDILEKRYAKGEIDKEEFEERRNNLL